MKIQAKELKTGMTIRLGYWVVEIEKISSGVQKNGKIFFTVSGKTVTTRKDKFGRTREFYSENIIRENTKVSIL